MLGEGAPPRLPGAHARRGLPPRIPAAPALAHSAARVEDNLSQQSTVDSEHSAASSSGSPSSARRAAAGAVAPGHAPGACCRGEAPGCGVASGGALGETHDRPLEDGERPGAGDPRGLCPRLSERVLALHDLAPTAQALRGPDPLRAPPGAARAAASVSLTCASRRPRGMSLLL
ncbi:unnamed protein product [Prorocentrum cordatum]|uniref:Uncharacterized protein n=1 Tax=Prorocentrum cordatum TaxID=2364126 RepID=A0ABN9UCG6_9DINO|nr:unnamed protein product [Polarella glacialis]